MIRFTETKIDEWLKINKLSLNLKKVKIYGLKKTHAQQI